MNSAQRNAIIEGSQGFGCIQSRCSWGDVWVQLCHCTPPPPGPEGALTCSKRTCSHKCEIFRKLLTFHVYFISFFIIFFYFPKVEQGGIFPTNSSFTLIYFFHTSLPAESVLVLCTFVYLWVMFSAVLLALTWIVIGFFFLKLACTGSILGQLQWLDRTWLQRDFFATAATCHCHLLFHSNTRTPAHAAFLSHTHPCIYLPLQTLVVAFSCFSSSTAASGL